MKQIAIAPQKPLAPWHCEKAVDDGRRVSEWLAKLL